VSGIALPARDFRFIVTSSHFSFSAGVFLRLVGIDLPHVDVDPLCSSVGQQYFSTATPPFVLGGHGSGPFVLLPSGQG